MKIFIITLFIIISRFAIVNALLAQDNLTTADQAINLPLKMLEKLNSTMSSLIVKIESRTEKVLRQFEKEESRLLRQIQSLDSTFDNTGLKEAQARYDDFIKRLKDGAYMTSGAGEYLSNFDSLKTCLRFLSQSSERMTKLASETAGIGKSVNLINAVNEKLKYINTIQQYLKDRKNVLHDQLAKFGRLNQLRKINKELYYYSQRVKEYKSKLNDPKQLELAAFRMLNKMPAFSDFFAKNSFIGSVFGNASFITNPNASSLPDISGLQSRLQVQQLVSNNINISGSGSGQDILQQKLSSVRDELNKLKSKNSSWDDKDEMPAFKPNEMKSKSFLKRLEFGANIQFVKSNSALPSSADLGVQLAYKFHQNGSVGFGASYRAGYSNIRRISISHQGIGLRTFIDHKLKSKIYINGGIEYNYNAAFKSVEALKDFNAWQKSALLGINRKYNISKKIKANTMLLYDFLHNRHVPASSSFIFRIGYNF